MNQTPADKHGFPQTELSKQAELFSASLDLRQKFAQLKENRDKTVISSPAEEQFWREQVDKAPAVLREKAAEAVSHSQNGMRHFAVGGVVAGALLSLANFSKRFSRGTKIAATVSAAAIAGGGIAVHLSQHSYANKIGGAVNQLADTLENSPELRAELMTELQKRVDGDNIAKGYRSVDEEIADAIHGYAMDKLGVGGVSVTNFGWQPLQPGQLGAASWQDVVSAKTGQNSPENVPGQPTR